MTDEIKRAMHIFAWTVKLNEMAKGTGIWYNCYFAGSGNRITVQKCHALNGMCYGGYEDEKHSNYTEEKGMKEIEDFLKKEYAYLGGMANEQSGTDGKTGG